MIRPEWRQRATLVAGRIMIWPDPDNDGCYAVEFFGSTENDGHPSDNTQGLTLAGAMIEAMATLNDPVNGPYWRGETDHFVELRS